MGDRANIRIAGVHLYTHWGGEGLPYTLREALKREERWGDDAYLARIIFCEMVQKDVFGETGYGISRGICDNEHAIINVDCETQKVSFLGEGTEGMPLAEPIPFKEYIALDDESLEKILRGLDY